MDNWQYNIQVIIEIIDQSIKSGLDESLTVDLISSKLGYSYFYTSRKFNEISGLQLKDYLRFRKLSFALVDLQDNNKSILDIATKYGFSSHEAFTRAFKATYGVTPSDYRENPVSIVLQSNFSLAMANLWRYAKTGKIQENEMEKSKWMAATLIAASSMAFFSCSNPSLTAPIQIPSDVNQETTTNPTQQNNTTKPTTPTTQENKQPQNQTTDNQPKENKLFAFDFADIETLATKYISDSASQNNSIIFEADAIGSSIDALKSLTGFKSDGTEKSILNFASGIALRVNTLKPILATFKCNKPNIDTKAKGVYSLFSSPFTPINEDGTESQSIGQLFYVYPSFKVIDIFGGDKNITIATSNAATYDKPLLQFDNDGKVYATIKNNGKQFVTCFDPVTNKRTDIKPPFNANGEEIGFLISPNGKWMLMYGFVDDTQYNSAAQGNHVLYFVPTDNPENAQLLYESKIKGYTGTTEPFILDDTHFTYSVYEPTYNVDYKFNSGSYTSTIGSNNSITTHWEGLMYNWNTNVWIWQLKNIPRDTQVTTATWASLTDEDLEKILKIMKSMCRTKSADQLIFSLKNIGEKIDVYNLNNPAAGLNKPDFYAEDAQNKPLTEIEALKFWGTGLISDPTLPKIMNLCNFAGKIDGISANDSNSNGSAFGALPINSMFYDKDEYENNYATAQPVDWGLNSTFLANMPADLGQRTQGFTGMWSNCTLGDGNDLKGKPFNYMDKDGNYVFSTPTALNSYVTYRDYNQRPEGRTASDPWYKHPFQTVEDKGIAYLLTDQQNVIYYNGSSVSTIASIASGKIYSYIIQNDYIVYTVKNADNSYTSWKKPLNGGAASKLNAVESLLTTTVIN